MIVHHKPGCVLAPNHAGECTTVPVLTPPPEPSAHPLRRHGDIKWYWRAGQWVLAPVVDGWHGLSLVRFIAITMTVAAVHGSFVHEQPLTWVDLSFATLAICAALGGKYVLAFLQRGQQDAREQGRRTNVELGKGDPG